LRPGLAHAKEVDAGAPPANAIPPDPPAVNAPPAGSESESLRWHYLLFPDEKSGFVRLYLPAEVNELRESLESKFREKATRTYLTKRLDEMLSKGPFRILGAPKAEWQEALDALGERYLNFSDIVDYIRTECTITSLSKDPAVHLSPLLLVGPPGIGKTAFAMDLAEILGSGFHLVSMENAQTSACLTGTDQHWGNTKTGMIFDALVDDDYINPVVMVDELDKARQNAQYDPVAPLLQLLEQRQAKQFRDQSIPNIAIDASRINWLLTANDIGNIASPILSRLAIFHVDAPSAAQTRKIITTIFRETVSALLDTVAPGPCLDRLSSMKLTSGAVPILSAMPVRMAKRQLRSAIAKALLRGSSAVEPGDVSAR
jgi:ATP-dependent Lon protease